MILVCGEALIDLFVDVGASDDAMSARAVPGGSPMNVAIGLARLGIASGFLGGLSQDAFGTRLAGRLEREGVSLALAPRMAARTTLSVVATDEAGHPTYSFYGEGGADVCVGDVNLPWALPEAVTALTFGSYTLAVDPVGAAYLALARRERKRRVVSLDPNVRPTVTPDRASWRERFEAFLACAAIVKASDEDIALGYGGEADIDRVAADWLARGVKLVVVTRGKKGACAYLRGHRVVEPGRIVTAIDTVGAGDTAHAAILARLSAQGVLTHEGLDRLTPAHARDALRYANAAAAITCSRRGADLPRADEVRLE